MFGYQDTLDTRSVSANNNVTFNLINCSYMPTDVLRVVTWTNKVFFFYKPFPSLWQMMAKAPNMMLLVLAEYTELI